MNRLRTVTFQLVLFVMIALSSSWAASNESVTVITRNMDAGTDFGFFFDYLQTNPALGVQLTWEELQKNDFPGRAGLLAQEIASLKPHLVGLQEVTRLSAGPTPDATNVVLMDQLQLLLGALAALGQPYSVVTSQKNLDVAFPVAADTVVRITDRDVILIRGDLPPGSYTNLQGAYYQTILSFSGITSYRGWISADVTVGTHALRFVVTHLESSGGLYGNPAVDFIQAAQATELAATFAGSPLPVAIAADFNSNAAHTPPEQTPSYGIMLTSGFTDSWKVIHRGEPGFTWPLYIEDPLRLHPKGPFERIDYVFSRGLTVSSSERTGTKAPHSSDHAGVAAVLGF